MSGKTVYAFSLSTSLMERVRQLMLVDSSRSKAQAPRPDEKGLIPEDYRALQVLVNSKAEGDELLNLALTHQSLGAIARRTFAEAQKRNRKLYAKSLTPSAPSLSSYVEELISDAVSRRNEQIPTHAKAQTQNATPKSASRKSGNARKVA